jgi:cytochrome c-type biogenesis protein
LSGITEISILTAFLAGVFSFLSPCILPVASGHITYITGAIIEDELKGRKLFALKQTLGFVLGFTAVFMIFGLSFGTIGMFMRVHKDLLNMISGAFIIFMGLNILGVLKFKLRGKRLKKPDEVTSWLGSVFVGLAFGIGWTPCIGPVLGTILFYAGSQTNAAQGAYLLLIYSIGLSIPFLITALLVDRISVYWKKLSRYTPILMKLSGIIVIAIGLLIFFNKLYLFTNLAY